MQPGTNKQLPDHAIMDEYNKQVYLGNQYAYALSNTSAGTAEVPIILLTNPIVSATSFPAGYVSLFVKFIKLTCSTASQFATLRVYLNPTITSAGTPVTPINLRPASTNTSISSLTTSPTIASNGSLISIMSSIPGESDMSHLMAVLDPAKSLLITVQTSASSTITGTQLSWFEI